MTEEKELPALNKPNMVEWKRLHPDQKKLIDETVGLDIAAFCQAHVKSDKESDVLEAFKSCLVTGYEMRTLPPSELWQSKYNQFRCCMTNKKSRDQVSCVRYKCYEDVLLLMPYACQSQFLLWRDDQCLGYTTEGYLGDCHDEVCSIVTLIYPFQTKLIFIIIVAMLSGTFAIYAATTKIFRHYTELGTKTQKKTHLKYDRRGIRMVKVKENTLITKDAKKIAIQAAYTKTNVPRKMRMWYYLKEVGGVAGPFSEDEMLERRRNGVIKDNTRIRCNNHEWGTVKNMYKDHRREKPFTKQATPQFRLTKEAEDKEKDKEKRKPKVGPAHGAKGKNVVKKREK